MAHRIPAFRIVPVLLLALGLAAVPAVAQETEPFTPERFAQLQEQGALVLLDVFADWCGTCAQQQRILADYRTRNTDAPLHVLQIDFDDQKEHVRRFRAPRQSTLILYHGNERVWFSVAETNADAIFAALDRAVAAAR
jgi:thioredoxin 1